MESKKYTPPTIKVLEVLVEKGFGESGGDSNGGGLGLPEWGII